jgi:hypothetical protein
MKKQCYAASMIKSKTTHRGSDYGSVDLGSHLHWPTATKTIGPNSVASDGYDRAVNEALSHFEGEGALFTVVRRGDGLYILKPHGEESRVYVRLFKSDVGSSELEADVLDLEPKNYPAVGWFQDAAGELYCHEGEGHWQGIALARCKELNKLAAKGELEFIS